MALAFEVIKNLTTEVDQNVEPYYVHTPYLIHEPDNSLFQYYIKPGTDAAWDKHADVTLGQYKTLPWGNPQHHLSTRAVSKIGAKQFPQIGAIGFYKDLYTTQSYILTPVHDKQETFAPPKLTAILSGDAVTITITPPGHVDYSCYKVILRSGYFAVEYVVYNLSTSVPKPFANGTYEVTVVGYNELTGIFSSPSNSVSLTVTDGTSTWAPGALSTGLKLSDLLDVNLVDLLNAQMLRFNAATQKWENVSATRLTYVTLLASAWVGSDNKYSQVVDIAGITKTSQVNLTPSVEQLEIFSEKDITFTTENNDGIITVYVIGQQPQNDYVIQADIVEVAV